MNTEQFANFLKKLSYKPLRVIDKAISLQSYVVIDISKDNQSLNNFDISSSNEWENYINNYLKKNNAKVAFGGYLEVRNLYNRSSHFQFSSELRDIHLGIDLWCASGTKVLTVLEGTIHSFKNNINHGDYGPTIILKHQVDTIIFYTLYGHLSLSSIQNITIGSVVQQGEVLGFLGNRSINGDYAPHLHFQIIQDIENYRGDYPGVSSIENISFYKKNCPNPNVLLKIF